MDEKLNQVLSQVFDLTKEQVKQNLSRTEIAKWDSLTHMDLVASLEREFQVVFELDDILALDGIEAIRGVVKRKVEPLMDTDKH